jgi:uncharacterized membrane protein YeaQ/YmgE (transglycosylase-associated protein family)
MITIIVIGGIIGWFASIIMKTDAQQGILLNIVVGIIGSVIAGYAINPILGGGTIAEGSFDVKSLFVSLLGAVLLLGSINLFRRGALR